MNLLKLRKQAGVTLLEIMLVLAVIALILVMAMRFWGATTRARELTEASQDVGYLFAAIHQWKGSQLDYTNLSATALANAKLVPNNFVVNGSNVSLPVWGGCQGNLVLTPTAASGNTPPTVQVQYTGIDSAVCNGLVPHYTEASNQGIIQSDAICSGGGGTGNCSSTFSVTIY